MRTIAGLENPMRKPNGSVWLDDRGYPNITIHGRRRRLHIVIWEEANGAIPKGFIIHHKDKNKESYKLSNLELMTRSDHNKVHKGWTKTEGVWTHKQCYKCSRSLPLDNFYQRKSGDAVSSCKECSKKLTKGILGQGPP